jgi:hypothetical protein
MTRNVQEHGSTPFTELIAKAIGASARELMKQIHDCKKSAA